MNQDDLQYMCRMNLQTQLSDQFCMIYFKIQNTALEDQPKYRNR